MKGINVRQPRIIRYMPPEQAQVADMLVRQNNLKVIDALNRQGEHLFRMYDKYSPSLKDDSIAWIRLYRPSTGQEWFVTFIQDEELYCMYYDGTFNKRLYDFESLRMKIGVVLDIYWSPKTLSCIQDNHRNCEEVRIKSKVPSFVRIMRKGNFTS